MIGPGCFAIAAHLRENAFFQYLIFVHFIDLQFLCETFLQI